jgi:DNA-directed RNA polymerase specialized sigma24 family protein
MTDATNKPPAMSEEQYSTLRRALVKFFTWNRAEDPDDLADETVLRVIQKVGAGEAIEDLTAYAHGVAHRVLQESRRNQRKRSSVDINIAPSAGSRIELLHRCLGICKKCLPRRDYALVDAYFQGEKAAKIANRRKLALKKKTSVGGLRLRVSRICKKLSPCMEDCVRRAAEAEMKSTLRD